MSIRSSLLAASLGLVFLTQASAQVAVSDAWVRATVPQQKATGAFMQLKAAKDSRLVAVSSSAVPVVELHEMSMQDGVMKMRQVPGLELPAGKTVALQPGGYHLMLLDLKQAMKVGDSVPLTLVLEDKSGKRESVQVKAEVRAMDAMPKPAEHQH